MKKIYTNEKYPRLDVNAQNQQILNKNQTFSISNNLLSSFKRLFRENLDMNFIRIYSNLRQLLLLLEIFSDKLLQQQKTPVQTFK